MAEALAGIRRVHLYPDPAQTAMRAAVGAHLGIGPEHIVVGNGSDEIIDLLFRAVLAPGDAALTCVPTFGMYEFTAHTSAGGGPFLWSATSASRSTSRRSSER